MQPGTTITPGQSDLPPQPVEPPTPPPSSEPAPEPVKPPPASPDTPVTNWQFTANDQSSSGSSDGPPVPQSIDPITWTASEYIDHEKNRGWFFAIGGAAILVAAIAYVLTRDVISVLVTLTAGILLAISGARKPHTLSFQMNDQGLLIGDKFYPFTDFKSFTVLEEGALSSIQLLPARRFMPSLSIYYPPEQEEAIITNLGNILPHEERERDAVDNLMRRIKF